MEGIREQVEEGGARKTWGWEHSTNKYDGVESESPLALLSLEQYC